MGNSTINFNNYRPFIETEEGFNKLQSYDADWFLEGTDFSSNIWIIKHRDGKLVIDFNQIIEPNVLLTDPQHEDLLLSIKISTYLVRVLLHKGMGGSTSSETQKAHATVLINFSRFMLLNGIHFLKNINAQLFQVFLSSSCLPVVDRLDSFQRTQEYINPLTKAYLHKHYAIKRSTNLPDLDVSGLFKSIGLTPKTASQDSDIAHYLLEIRKKYGFFIKTDKLTIKEKEKKGTDSMRKELSSIDKFIQQTILMPDLFPTSHRFKENFFSTQNININRYSKLKGEKGGQTKNIPVPIFFEAMDTAIRWVVNYSNELLELLDKFNEELSTLPCETKSQEKYRGKKMSTWLMRYKPKNKGKNSPFPIVSVSAKVERNKQKTKISDNQMGEAFQLLSEGKNYEQIGQHFGTSKSTANKLMNRYEEFGSVHKQGISLNQAVYQFLPSACILVLYTFTARRECEVEALTSDVIKNGICGPSIKMYSAKYYRSEQTFPTTKLAKQAFDILCSLSEPVRSEENDMIFQFPSLTSVKKFKYWAKESLPKFAAFIDLPLDDNNEMWQFSEHQFRRMFAYMYYYRWRKGDLATLSWHLRHTDWETTRKYIEDTDGMIALNNVEKESIYDITMEAIKPKSDQTTPLEGKMVEELSELFSSINLESSSGSTMEKLLRKKIDEVGFILEFIEIGACFGKSPSLKEKSNCYKHGKIHQGTSSSEQCDNCPSLLIFDANTNQSNEPQVNISPILEAVLGV